MEEFGGGGGGGTRGVSEEGGKRVQPWSKTWFPLHQNISLFLPNRV